MKWIRRHIVEILMIVLNTFLLTNLILSAYDEIGRASCRERV